MGGPLHEGRPGKQMGNGRKQHRFGMVSTDRLGTDDQKADRARLKGERREIVKKSFGRQSEENSHIDVPSGDHELAKVNKPKSNWELQRTIGLAAFVLGLLGGR